jgi:UDP-glucuronate 4-epimerase
VRNFLPMQDGDVQITYADTTRLQAAVRFTPATPLAVGIGRFVEWYRVRYPG